MKMMRKEVKIEVESSSDLEGDDPPSIYCQFQHPVTLQFKDIVYKIKTKANSDERTILKGISGSVVPGEMLAVMGPSGSGKTTLLTALGGRLGSTPLLSGTITYNGAAYSSAVKRNMGFVTQDDILHPHLTVSETLLYTALLRLPCSLSHRQKAARAGAVIASLDLAGCRDSMVGNGLVRGVSGGERKRVSIGQEMLIDPGILFLDEPTSGLDSTTAQRIMSVLAELAKGGRTVVMTIHQPSSRLFYMFHKVLLLSDGSPIYFGNGLDLMPYFTTIGYAPAEPMNPADFFLDLANGMPSEDSQMDRQLVKEALISAYSVHLKKMEEEFERVVVLMEGCNESKGDRKATRQWNTTWWEQFKILLERDLKERKHGSYSVFSIVQISLMSLVTGLLWWQSAGRVEDQIGLLFFVSAFWAFFSFQEAIFTFPDERATLTKERSSGMYRLSSYFMARMVGDLPMELVLPTASVTIIYWMSGLKASAGNYFATTATVLLTVLDARGLGLALGAVILDHKTAITFGASSMLTFMLAGGFYVQHAPAFISWIKFLSFLFYSFKLLLISQYSPDETYACDNHEMISCKVADFSTIKHVGLDHTEITITILLIMFAIYRLIAYVALMRVG